ncbi:hypothetical protein NBRC110019_25400 [Neptunitalea chrysea]|uniref:Uncharacterized protein n=1 Tax=Neptunitalea chrysea TaxID=1647581 RepID=A0A9W6B6C2_9FLAO|nr:hypothetical protein [Neptunitalea chrysea]GLB53499.1 hypothetical protein NBRC110019_25400 [Neptunitalea chrysea]
MATILKRRVTNNDNVIKCYDKLDTLLTSINEKEIPEKLQNVFNKKITTINNFSGDDKKFIKIMNTSYVEIVQLLKTELKMVPKNYYMTIGISLGIAASSLLIGIITYKASSNPLGIALGVPFGLIIGMVIGMYFDKKVKAKNRQL